MRKRRLKDKGEEKNGGTPNPATGEYSSSACKRMGGKKKGIWADSEEREKKERGCLMGCEGSEKRSKWQYLELPLYRLKIKKGLMRRRGKGELDYRGGGERGKGVVGLCLAGCEKGNFLNRREGEAESRPVKKDTRVRSLRGSRQ